MSKTIYTASRTTKNHRFCKYCDASLENHHFNAQFCSKEHRKLLLQNETVENSIRNSTPDMVECKICGLRAHNLNSHISSIHKINVVEYKKIHNDAPLQSKKYTEAASERIRGKKNPAWQHGGKYSPYSEKFIKYTDGSVEYSIEDIYEKIRNAKKDNPQNDTTKIEYYLKQGLSHDEAVEALATRQTTFSKKVCIEKYGKKEGLKRWKERQEKWQGTLTKKSKSEIDIINQKKSTGRMCQLFSSNPEVKNVPAILYYIRFYDDDFEFWKIGITSQTIKKRFAKYKLKYEIIFEDNTMNFYDAWKKEQEFLKKYKNKRINVDHKGLKTTEAFFENVIK